jgi:hypothetical protein
MWEWGNMKFEMDKFSVDELTGGTELAKWVCDTYLAVADYEYDHIKSVRFEIVEGDDEGEWVMLEGFEWLKDHRGSSTEVWVCWTEDDDEMIEWWITGDDC